MNFHKDLLIIDLETTGLNPKKYEIIQLGAILLDKQTLKELASFATFVKPTKWKNRDSESMKVNGIKLEQLKNSPTISAVIKEFGLIFNKPIILCNYGGILDNVFLLEAFKKLKIPYPFDYHTFNIWSLLYPFMAKRNFLKNNKKYSGFGLDDAMRVLKIKPSGIRHDALADCRLEAELLRKLAAKI